MTIKVKQTLLAASVAAVVATPITGFATNGMNLEGYGPIATGMGGASYAYDNGSAAVMNNPATIGLMDDGEGRLDVALGNLGPDITSTHTGIPNSDTTSTADSFYMPAVGYVQRDGSLSYGVGMSAQGGMGTEYAANSFLAAGTNEIVRSEVSVGRLVAPIAYNVDKNLTVGGSIDYVWAGMDLKMALAGFQFFDFVGAQTTGQASGDLVGTFGTMFLSAADGSNVVTNPDGSVTDNFTLFNARFDFSNDSDISGEAKGAGFGGKIGFTYKVNNNLTVAGTYHTKTNIGDLDTSDAVLSMNSDAGSFAVAGSIAVVDFQWPSTFGLGLAYKQDKWMVAADVKVLQWSDVMDSFRMSFTANATQTGGAVNFAGQSMDVEMFQNWEDQTVVHLGGAYKVTSATTLRAGINAASNPVPDATLNPLFPATIETHYTLGVGHALSKKSGVNFSLTIAPEVDVTGASGVTTTHAQQNWQFMYTQKF